MNADKILALASRKEGVTYYEAHHAIGEKSKGCASSYLSRMTRNQELIKAGTKNHIRYFVNQSDAEAYQEKADAERIVRMDEAKKRRYATVAKIRKIKPIKRKNTKKIQALLDKKPKAQNIVIETKQQAIDKKRAHLKAVIEWPEHVKVQVIEGFKGDTRYQAEPGYVGSFTKEWQERRAA